MADHDAGRSAAAAIIGDCQKAAPQSLDAQYAKEIAANKKSLRVADLAARREVERSLAPCQHPGKSLLPIADAFPERIGQLRMPATKVSLRPTPIGDFYFRQLLRILYRQGSQTHGIEQLENRSVRADTERQRCHGDQRKTGIQPQQAHPIAQVLPERFQESDAVHVIDLLPDKKRVSQLPARRIAGFPRRHSARHVLPGFDFEMRFKFPCAFGIPAGTAEEADPTHVSILRWAKHAANGTYELIPAAGLRRQLFAAGASQPVIPGLSIVFRRSPERGDPAPVLETMQGRVK